jgi:hypothetical protein
LLKQAGVAGAHSEVSIAVQATQVLSLVRQTSSVQFALLVHSTHVLFEQTLALAGQALVSLGVQATQVWSLVRQTSPVQSAEVAHSTHSLLRQTGSAMAQLPALVHSTHMPVAPTQTGFAPEQAVPMFVH